MSEVENTSFEACLQKLMTSLEASLYEEATAQLAKSSMSRPSVAFTIESTSI